MLTDMFTLQQVLLSFENTLRIEILFAERPQIKSLVELLKKLFNQESIAVQEEEITSDLW